MNEMNSSGLTFRVFVSSTFGDFVAERNYLQSESAHRLQRYCQERGVKFQLVDLRWGASDDVAQAQGTMQICISELRRCQKISPRLHLIVLLGDRYGWRPLPSEIDASEFDRLLSFVDVDSQAFVRSWYARDENALQPKMILRPRHGEYRHIETWQATESQLRDVFLSALRHAQVDDPSLSLKYEASAVHQEIQEGVLSGNYAGAFCYRRKIDRLPKDRRAGVYRDLREGKHDEELQARLDGLQEEVKRVLGDRFRVYPAQWEEGGPSYDLKVMCTQIENDLIEAIDEEIRSFSERDPGSPDSEVHAEFAASSPTEIVGRNHTLDLIRAYVTDDSTEPMFIYGPSGSGKTTVVAKAAGLDVLQASDVVLRFIGLTPESSTVDALLGNVSLELGFPSSHAGSARTAFVRGLQTTPAESQLVLFFDGLEKLAFAESGDVWSWLPSSLPSQLKLILTFSSDDTDSGRATEGSSPKELLHRLKKAFPAARFHRLERLSPEDSKAYLKRSLQAKGRTLMPQQWSRVEPCLGEPVYPLYLCLILAEVATWRSFDEGGYLPADTSGMVNRLFARLEHPANHGPTLVGQALRYLGAARRGLSEDELIDLLSNDDAVLRDVRERSPNSPQFERLPFMIWARLRGDLGDYLVEHRVRGTLVLSFFHRAFLEATRRRFLYGPETTTPGRETHRLLSALFARDGLVARDDRQLDEVPWHFIHSRSWESLHNWTSNSGVVAAYDRALLVDQLVADLRFAAQSVALQSNAVDDRIYWVVKLLLARDGILDFMAGSRGAPASTKQAPTELLDARLQGILRALHRDGPNSNLEHEVYSVITERRGLPDELLHAATFVMSRSKPRFSWEIASQIRDDGIRFRSLVRVLCYTNDLTVDAIVEQARRFTEDDHTKNNRGAFLAFAIRHFQSMDSHAFVSCIDDLFRSSARELLPLLYYFRGLPQEADDARTLIANAVLKRARSHSGAYESSVFHQAAIVLSRRLPYVNQMALLEQAEKNLPGASRSQLARQSLQQIVAEYLIHDEPERALTAAGRADHRQCLAQTFLGIALISDNLRARALLARMRIPDLPQLPSRPPPWPFQTLEPEAQWRGLVDVQPYPALDLLRRTWFSVARRALTQSESEDLDVVEGEPVTRLDVLFERAALPDWADLDEPAAATPDFLLVEDAPFTGNSKTHDTKLMFEASCARVARDVRQGWDAAQPFDPETTAPRVPAPIPVTVPSANADEIRQEIIDLTGYHSPYSGRGFQDEDIARVLSGVLQKLRGVEPEVRDNLARQAIQIMAKKWNGRNREFPILRAASALSVELGIYASENFARYQLPDLAFITRERLLACTERDLDETLALLSDLGSDEQIASGLAHVSAMTVDARNVDAAAEAFGSSLARISRGQHAPKGFRAASHLVERAEPAVAPTLMVGLLRSLQTQGVRTSDEAWDKFYPSALQAMAPTEIPDVLAELTVPVANLVSWRLHLDASLKQSLQRSLAEILSNRGEQ